MKTYVLTLEYSKGKSEKKYFSDEKEANDNYDCHLAFTNPSPDKGNFTITLMSMEVIVDEESPNVYCDDEGNLDYDYEVDIDYDLLRVDVLPLEDYMNWLTDSELELLNS